MPGRYTGVVGKNLTGDRQRAAELLPLARKLAQQALEKVASFGGSGTYTVSETTPGGSRVAAWVAVNPPNPPIVRVWVRAPIEKPGGAGDADVTGDLPTFLVSVWEPEGILITPRSVSAPYGYGFPKRDLTTGEKINPPFGTLQPIESKDYPYYGQVLFNKFAGNKYLDDPEYLVGVSAQRPANKKLAADVESQRGRHWDNRYLRSAVVYEPAADAPEFSLEFWAPGTKDASGNYTNLYLVDAPGINLWLDGSPSFMPARVTVDDDGKRIPALRQFDAAGESLIYEAESDAWFCHWPEEELYANSVHEALFQATNAERIASGVQPVTRGVRGRGNPAHLAAVEMQRAEVLFHNNKELYRPGHWSTVGRAMNSGWSLELHQPLGENLQVNRSASSAEETAERVIEWFKTSPAHYANIIYEPWGDWGSGAVYFGGPALMDCTESGEPNPEVFDPPFRDVEAFAQMFHRAKRWLAAGPFVQESALGRVSSDSYNCPVGDIYPDLIALNSYTIYYHGMAIPVRQLKEAFEDANLAKVVVLGVTLFDGVSGVTLRVVAGILTQAHYGDTDTTRILVLTLPVRGIHESFIGTGGNEGADFDGAGWTEEFSDTATLPGIACFIPSACSFSPDGNKGVFSITAWADDEYETPTDFIRASDLSPPGISRRYRMSEYLYDASGEEPTLTLIRHVPVPSLAHSYSYSIHPIVENEEHWLESFQVAYTTPPAPILCYPYYDASGNIQRLSLTHDYEITQTAATSSLSGDPEAYYRVSETLTLPSGVVIPVCYVESTNGVLHSGCQVTKFLYLNPLTGDRVLAHADYTQSGTTIYCDISVSVNGTTVKTYPQQVAVTGVGDPSFFGRVYFESGHRVLGSFRGVLNTQVFRGTYENGDYSHLPEIRDMDEDLIDVHDITSGTQTIGGEITYAGLSAYSQATAMHDGDIPLSFAPGSVDNHYRYAIDGDALNRGYVDDLPTLCGIQIGGEYVRCEVARYKERLVVGVQIDKIFGYEPSPTDSSIIYANFDLDAEVGIGSLTSIFPMGVI